MRYLLLIYTDESQRPEMTEAESTTINKRWADYTNWLTEKGWMRAGDALQPTDQATSVTTRGTERVVTDGPFAETKEQLGGFYMIEVENLDDAIEAAARCPGAELGTMEVRPIIEFDPAESATSGQ
jgi:hypothetical protein